MFAAKKQETVLEAQTRELNVPRYLFLQRVKCGYEMARNHPKHEFKTEIVDWACLLKKTRNGSRGINSCIKCASIPVFATCQVRL